MKPIVLTSFLLAAIAGEAMAVCENSAQVTSSSSPSLSTLLSGSLVCGRPSTGYPGSPSDRWQEEHLASGQLFDYKLGPGHPVDPRKEMGIWKIADRGSNTTVGHIYTGDGTYTWTVHRISGNTYSFCSGSIESVRAFIGPNPGTGCAGNFP